MNLSPLTPKPLRELSVPPIETERLRLNDFRETDAEGVYRYASQPQVVRTVSWEAHRSVAESMRYVRELKSRVSYRPDRFFLAWCVRLKGSDEVIGSVTFTQLGPVRGQIGYVLNYDHWDQGYTREACEAVIEWIFNYLGAIERVQGRCLPHNVGSRRVMEKIGMSFEGVNRSMMRAKGEILDLACFAITRRDWGWRHKDGVDGASIESETPGSHC